MFADPDRFDVRRPTPHLLPPHFCLGPQLARLEARIAVETLLDRLAYLSLDPRHSPGTPRGLVFRKPPELHVCPLESAPGGMLGWVRTTEGGACRSRT